MTMNTLMRRRWINLGLLGLAVGLAALVWPEPDRELPVIPPLLGMVATDPIKRIEVLRADQDPAVAAARDVAALAV